MNLMKRTILLTLLCVSATGIAQNTFIPSIQGAAVILKGKDGTIQTYKGEFTILYASSNPLKELRRGDFGYKMDPTENTGLLYNIPTWGKAEKLTLDTSQHVEDGSNPLFDRGFGKGRTADYFSAANAIVLTASEAKLKGNTIEWSFPVNAKFSLQAKMSMNGPHGFPKLEFSFNPKANGWFSVGYTGAPAYDTAECEEIWQPLIWQEKRFPNLAYLSEASRCPLPTTFVTHKNVTLGIVADPSTIPYEPIPTSDNSNFGVLVRNSMGLAQPMLFAPILGNKNSEMKAGDSYSFMMYIFQNKGDVIASYEHLARTLFSFKDHRYNTFINLNGTIANTTDYCMSPYSMFVDSLRGNSYSTDVPGAVKNISGLHPLSISMISDNSDIYFKRARPMLEYGLSRERFLFSTNPAIKGQGTSARLSGPGVPLSDLSTTYSLSLDRMNFIKESARNIYENRINKVLNLDAVSYGLTWQNALYLYRATKEPKYLAAAKVGADEYLKARVYTKQTDFKKDTLSLGMFFWTSYTNQYMELYLMYKTAGDKRYLDAAWDGARRYTQFCWLTPIIPAGKITVNKGGVVPRYRSGDRFRAITIPEETVDAWRVSEIGLTTESSATSSGHRGIFMANHAPFMLRIAAEKSDKFLRDVARSAVVGRYASFPGYHINAGRTTAFEKADFPNRTLEELNGHTSLHYNHPWSQLAMLYDYLLADVYYVSRRNIDFPVEYAEGYAYCRSLIFGLVPGKFYTEKGVRLYMPKNILTVSNVQANYITGYGNGKLYIALTNQWKNNEKVTIKFDEGMSSIKKNKKYKVKVWKDNKPIRAIVMTNGEISTTISPEGITAFAIEGVEIHTAFQQKILAPKSPWKKDNTSTGFENDKAVIFNFGKGLVSAYVWMEADDAKYSRTILHYAIDGNWKIAEKTGYPYDFTVDIADGSKKFEYYFEATSPANKTIKSAIGFLEK